MFLLLACSAQAWNSLGHRAVAELAWRQMDARERQAVSALLQQHPHYSTMLANDVPQGVDTNEWAFLAAATWPDRVRPAKPGERAKPRSVTKYNVHPHGIDLPFVSSPKTDGALLKSFVLKKPNAATVLEDSIATLRNKKASGHDRAVSLCWVLHLFGDLHQPLHAATLVTEKHPQGNGLGGNCIVRNGGDQVSLHALWDQLPGSDASYEGITKLADALAAAPEFKPASLKAYGKNKTAMSWAMESHRAAVDYAYAEERVKWADAAAIKSGEVTGAEIPTITPEYLCGAQDLARLRLALAAQRLTQVLKRFR